MIDIVPAERAHAEGVISLILPIQQAEFGIPITRDDQPDLQDPPASYRRGSGNFWVALDGERVVGTIALLDIGARQAALRKMFVAASHRGAAQGIAARLLATLVLWCQSRGVREVFLGTTDRFHAAHRFYEKNGFVEIARGALPAGFPVMAVDTKFYRIAILPGDA